MLEYKIVHGSSTHDLGYWVTEHIKDGWRPTGDVFTSKDEGIYGGTWLSGTVYNQPMVKGE